MRQFIGLILLVLAIAAAIYVFSHGKDLLQLRVPIPTLIKPITVPTPPEIPKIKPEIKIENPAPTPEPKPESKPAVKIDSIERTTSYRPFIEVVLRSDLEKGETVNIAGWTIKSNFGFFVIPQAQKIYSFGGVQGDIILGYRDSVHFYSGRGVKGNFLLNKCSGYFQDIVPLIPKQCPRPTRSEVENFDGYSQDYILSLKSCEQPSANPPIPRNDSACYDFLRTLNYSGCVEKYKNDTDFLLGEWWVWLDNQINIFDPVHDRAQLLDKEGNLIDEYKY